MTDIEIGAYREFVLQEEHDVDVARKLYRRQKAWKTSVRSNRVFRGRIVKRTFNRNQSVQNVPGSVYARAALEQQLTEQLLRGVLKDLSHDRNDTPELATGIVGRVLKSQWGQYWRAVSGQNSPQQHPAVYENKTAFLPSQRLTAYWARGLRDHIDEMRGSAVLRDGYQAMLDDAPNVTAAFLSRKLKRIFAVIVNRQRYGIVKSNPIAQDGRFLLYVMHEVLDRITVRPDETNIFFSLLFEELTFFLAGGGSMSGSWGKLVARGRSILIIPTQLPNADENWVRANVVE